MPPRRLATPADYRQALVDGDHDGRLVVVRFARRACMACERIAPIFDAMHHQLPFVSFCFVDVDESPLMAECSKVQLLPTFAFHRRGRLVDRYAGTDESTLRGLLRRHGDEAPTPRLLPSKATARLHHYFRQQAQHHERRVARGRHPLHRHPQAHISHAQSTPRKYVPSHIQTALACHFDSLWKRWITVLTTAHLPPVGALRCRAIHLLLQDGVLLLGWTCNPLTPPSGSRSLMRWPRNWTCDLRAAYCNCHALRP